MGGEIFFSDSDRWKDPASDRKFSRLHPENRQEEAGEKAGESKRQGLEEALRLAVAILVAADTTMDG